jgi:hypothetical protein
VGGKRVIDRPEIIHKFSAGFPLKTWNSPKLFPQNPGGFQPFPPSFHRFSTVAGQLSTISPISDNYYRKYKKKPE